MTWEDAMWQFGNDKPDIRFGMSLCNLKKPGHVFVEKQDQAHLINGVDFKVFDEAETVIAIAAPGCSEYSRKQTDELTEWVKRPQIGMKGLVFIKCNTDGTFKSSVDKFYSEDKLKAIAPRLNYGKLATSLSQLKIHSIPSIYFFNSRSQIIKKHTGNIRWEDYSTREHYFKLLQIQ